jgi:uncharacterized protein YdaU (DUF1376 family)
MNYYPFHLGDYAAHTAHLEPMEDLAYRRMLDLYYMTERALPYDWRDIARLVRLRDHGQAIEAVLAEFFSLTDDGWVHARCDAEIARMQDKQAKARASGKASANARLAKQVNGRSTDVQRTFNDISTDVQLPTPTPTPKEKTEPRSRCVSVDNLVSEGVAEPHARDWIAIRKAKKLVLTPTAWTATKLEALKANLSPAQAVQMAAENGWAGFKAAWVEQAKTLIRGQVTVESSAAAETAVYLDQLKAEKDKATKPPPQLRALLRRVVPQEATTLAGISEQALPDGMRAVGGLFNG